MVKKVLRKLLEYGPYLFIIKLKRLVFNKTIRFIWKMILNNQDSVNLNKNGINLIGFYKYSFGIAEVARAFTKSILGSNIKFDIVNIESDIHSKIEKSELEEFKKYFRIIPSYYKNVFFINGNLMDSFYQTNAELFRNKYNIGVWWWEFETGNESFIPGFAMLDEVFVFTEFIKQSFLNLPHGNCKITKITYPLTNDMQILCDKRETRREYRIDEGDFVVFFNFDYLSGYERKNPEGVLKAFKMAFEKNKNCRLILKTSNSEACPDKVENILSLINKYSLEKNLIIINKVLTKKGIMNLLSGIDCYISLHRGEGFGLGMLEAMSIGKPVIATNYGGNLEFMNESNSYLVSHKMVKANDDYQVYKDVKYWAEPDLDHAVFCLKEIYENPSLTERRCIKAKSDIKRIYFSGNFSEEIHKALEM